MRLAPACFPSARIVATIASIGQLARGRGGGVHPAGFQCSKSFSPLPRRGCTGVMSVTFESAM